MGETIFGGFLEKNSRGKTLTLAKVLLALVGIGLFFYFYFIPVGGLDEKGQKVLAIFVLALCLWVSQTVSPTIVSIIVMFLMWFTGVVKGLGDGFSGMSDTTVIFILFAFMISAAMTKTNIGARVAFQLLSRVKGGWNTYYFALMGVTLLMGFLVPSGSARAALMATVALALFPAIGAKEGSPEAKSLFVPLAYFVGSSSRIIMTGGGGSATVLGVIENIGKVTPTYFEWLLIALVPMIVIIIIMMPITKFIFKPKLGAKGEQQGAIKEELAKMGKMSLAEKKTGVIVGAVLLLWITGDFFDIDYRLVGVVGGILLFLPGIGVLNAKDIKNRVAWQTLMFLAGVIVLTNALDSSGVAEMIALLVQPLLGSEFLPIFMLKVAILATVLHIITPSSVGSSAAYLPIIMSVGMLSGFNPVVVGVGWGVLFMPHFMVYQQTQTVIMYGYEQFEAPDFMKWGICLIVVTWILAIPFSFYWMLF